ncbi:hypothetical protein MRB53_040156 [Persea americana]|nr:hypothetical protein MRB53_040156 [Persea americana]
MSEPVGSLPVSRFLLTSIHNINAVSQRKKPRRLLNRKASFAYDVAAVNITCQESVSHVPLAFFFSSFFHPIDLVLARSYSTHTLFKYHTREGSPSNMVFAQYLDIFNFSTSIV